MSERELTAVVGERHNGGEVVLAVLREDTKAGHGAFLAGDVEGRVAIVVGQPGVAPGF